MVEFDNYKLVDKGVCAAKGFKAGGINVGIKPVLEKDWKKVLSAGGAAYFSVSGCRFGAEAGKDTSVYGGSGYWLDKDPAMDLSRHAKMFVSRVDCNSTHFQPRNSALFMEAMKLRRNARFSENFSKGRDDARNS